MSTTSAIPMTPTSHVISTLPHEHTCGLYGYVDAVSFASIILVPHAGHSRDGEPCGELVLTGHPRQGRPEHLTRMVDVQGAAATINLYSIKSMVAHSSGARLRHTSSPLKLSILILRPYVNKIIYERIF